MRKIIWISLIFSYVHEKNKLEIIKYNKNLQNKLGIKLINYKLYGGVYIQYESKTKGKEYYGNSGRIRLEGEYLNGKRNGKGKEYNDDGNLEFDGEYLNEKTNKKENEYNNGDYDLDFYKKYLNEEGKEFFDGRLYFEGYYVNGKKNGKAKVY